MSPKVSSAYVEFQLPANSIAINIVQDTPIVYNTITTNDKHRFSLKSDGTLKIKKCGNYCLFFNNNYYNPSMTATANFAIYASLNGQIIPASQIVRTVSPGLTSPLTGIVSFEANKGDRLSISVTQDVVSPLFQTPASPFNQGFPNTSPVTQTPWSPHYYELIFIGK